MVQVEGVINRLVQETLTEIHKGVHNRPLEALETLLVHTVHKTVNSPEFISRYLVPVIDNPRFTAPVVVLVNLEQQKLVPKKAKIENRCQLCVETGTRMDPGPVLAPSEGRK